MSFSRTKSVARQEALHPGRRKVAALGQPFLQPLVARRALDEFGEALLGEAGAGIAGHAAQHLPVAARDQDVGHGRGQGRPRADREEMALTFRPGNSPEIGIVELGRMAEHRVRHPDLVVRSQPADRFGRGIRDMREAVRQLGTGFLLDMGDQQSEHRIGRCGRGLAARGRARGEEIRQRAQGLASAVARRVGEQSFDL